PVAPIATGSNGSMVAPLCPRLPLAPMPGPTMVAVPPRSPRARARRASLDGARGEAACEVPLRHEEHDEHRAHGHEQARGEERHRGRVLTLERRETHREGAHVRVLEDEQAEQELVPEPQE